VRVYYFCMETGVYQGAGFQDDDVFDESDGTTTVAPPDYGNGEIPVYDAVVARWDICTIAWVRSGGMLRC